MLGVACVLLPQPDFFTAIPGDLGDEPFVLGQAASLWNPRFVYPCSGATAFSGNLFGSAPAYIPMRLASLAGYKRGDDVCCEAGRSVRSGYVGYEHLDETAFGVIAARVVPVGLDACDPIHGSLRGNDVVI